VSVSKQGRGASIVRGKANNVQTKIYESRVAEATPNVAYASTVRHDVILQNLWPYECDLHLVVECTSSAVPISYSGGGSWKQSKRAAAYARVPFNDLITIGAPSDLGLLPTTEDLSISTAISRAEEGSPREPGAKLTHSLKIAK
jgi:hypothetical protein